MTQEGTTKQPDETFCVSCGTLIKKDVEFCHQCGTPSGATGAVAPPRGQSVSQQTPLQNVAVQPAQTKQLDEVFCQSCGAAIKREAAMCVHCGVPVRRASAGASGKSKVASILLAVFLGFWTWLYTYRADGWKFWLALSISIVNGILIFVTLGVWLIVAWIPGLAFWIWPIVDAAVKNDEWYTSYE
jgi:RNA polymerase subunit RPABC4/transcription elongation factor Spt4